MATTIQPISDTYKSIESASSGIYKDNGSKFLSFAYPVTSTQEVKSILQDIKKEYFDARHHCYAYRIGYNGEQWRANDDGEPSSTAGKPIYGQILSNELSDILIIVVRYFGGIKLGVPGLIKAYKSASSDALTNASIITKIATQKYYLEFDYLEMNQVMKILKDLSLAPYNQNFNLKCSLEVDVRLTDIKSWEEKASSFFSKECIGKNNI